MTAAQRSAVLTGLTPVQAEAWAVMFDLYDARPRDWVLLGGQMVTALAAENGRRPPRATVDMDVVADVRAEQGLTAWVARWLTEHGFHLAGINGFGIGHRFERASADAGSTGRVLVDVLAPEGLGERTSIQTSPPARTIEVPAASQALARAQAVHLSVATDRPVPGLRASGHVLLPTHLSAIIAKATATSIVNRVAPDRDWVDVAFLVATLPDPYAISPDDLAPKDRRRLGKLKALRNVDHAAWRAVAALPDGPDLVREGRFALDVLLDIAAGRAT